MALSNRDRVGKGFELLARGLAPFVERHMRAARGDGWVEELERRDTAKHGSARNYSVDDPRFLLKVMTEEWRMFRDSLSRVEQAFASELRDVGNRLAHEFGSGAFGESDTQRALDTTARLLQATGAATEADEVQRMLLDFQQAVFEKRTRRAAKESLVAGLEGHGLKPWREVITPHRDVIAGNFGAAQFAADLGNVALGEGSSEYTDPIEFFRRTYLTEGLRDLLGRAVRRVSGDPNASPVINLQTNFGGGKTHSMLALYHIFSGRSVRDYPQEVQELLDGAALPTGVRRVVLVGGTKIAPGKALLKEDGTRVNTLWGELAWQLGGRAAYDSISEYDTTKTSPGTALQELIAAYTPCLLLIDEWVAYARQLYSDDTLPAGRFDTQFTFAQALTESVKAVPGAMLAVSIPASDDDGSDGLSDIEVGGTNGREALKRLQQVVGRVADPWKAATAKESFEIVRRRLFEEPDGQARTDIAAVARRFTQFYLEHHGEFPAECVGSQYEREIRAAYPIHPELFERLYEDWSTLERFQRTRGVLTLMSNVIRTLWEANDPSPMIMPGTVPLAEPTVGGQLSQYLDDAWGPIIESDVAGPSSTPTQVDHSRSVYGQRSLTKRLAGTVFVGSAPTLKLPNKGIDRQRIWLGTAVPGDPTGHFGSALQALFDQATYLYAEGDRYWYDTQQSLTRTARDYADRLRDQPEEVWEDLAERLRKAGRGRGGFAGVHTCPADTGDIPDDDTARLVIIHPEHRHKRKDAESAAMRFARDAVRHRGGTSQRKHANMLVFLAADTQRLEDLMEAGRSYLAWKDIDKRADELNLTATQHRMVRDRRRNADEAVMQRLKETYIWTLLPEQPDGSKPPTMAEVKTDSSSLGLVERVSERLVRDGSLADRHAPQNISYTLKTKLPGVWESKGHISLGELWGLYTKYNYMPRLRDRSVLVTGVQDVLGMISWEQEGFALADSFADDRYEGLAIPHADHYGQITDTTLLVVPDRAVAQRAAETSAGRGDESDDDATGGETGFAGGGEGAGGDDDSSGRRYVQTQFFGVYRVVGEKYGKALKELQLEILPHLAEPGTDLEITVEIKARRDAGFDETKQRIVTENADVLKFEQADFED